MSFFREKNESEEEGYVFKRSDAQTALICGGKSRQKRKAISPTCKELKCEAINPAFKELKYEAN